MVNGLNKELKDLLEHKFNLYNSTNFIIEDPISIPHLYNQKEDIEIISFLISIISWGNRKSIIKSGNKDRKSTRLNSSHSQQSRMPSSA